MHGKNLTGRAEKTRGIKTQQRSGDKRTQSFEQSGSCTTDGWQTFMMGMVRGTRGKGEKACLRACRAGCAVWGWRSGCGDVPSAAHLPPTRKH